MRALVTGVAGFIGSHLAEALIAGDHLVRGVDCFTPFYDKGTKRTNILGLMGSPGFELFEADLRTHELAPLLEGVDIVFHEAAQAGVRPSWSDNFGTYVSHNVSATQRLLEAVRTSRASRFIYASSSSVYGEVATSPVDEATLPQPHSPYGVTKLAAEHLCGLYSANWGVPTISLRYFTVFGPRQRPDMAIHRFIESALDDTETAVYGDGDQVRDFTYVSDVVGANLAAMHAEVPPGTVMNVAGGCVVTVNELLGMIGALTGQEVEVRRLAAQAGEVRRTGGDTHAANRLLGWRPQTSLEAGLAEQLAWHRGQRASAPVILS
jgi:nucleoside-diphosphate-sugar epimerase